MTFELSAAENLKSFQKYSAVWKFAMISDLNLKRSWCGTGGVRAGQLRCFSKYIITLQYSSLIEIESLIRSIIEALSTAGCFGGFSSGSAVVSFFWVSLVFRRVGTFRFSFLRLKLSKRHWRGNQAAAQPSFSFLCSLKVSHFLNDPTRNLKRVLWLNSLLAVLCRCQ